MTRRAKTVTRAKEVTIDRHRVVLSVLLVALVFLLGPSCGPVGSASEEGAGSLGLPAGGDADGAVAAGYVPAGDADWETTAVEPHSRYGEAVALAGNVDGYHGDDVLVGAPKDGTIDGGGVAYLYLSEGGALGKTHVWSGSSGKDGSSYGSAVASAGDVNDDGLDDVIIGAVDYKAWLYVNGELKEVKAGGAFVYLGDAGTGLDLEPTWSYTGTVKEGEFAYAVAGAGDVSRDGIDDIVVGARKYTDQPDVDPPSQSGAIYVFYGADGDGPSAEPDWFISSPQAGAWFGASVSAAGDVNDDGYGDLIVGAPKYINPETGEPEGAAFLFLGGESPPDEVADAAWIAYGWQVGSGFGTKVASAGDVNGDGDPDVVVSAPGYLRPSDDALVGAAFAFCGNGTTYGSDPCWMAYGAQPAGGFGASVGAAGDLNDDGFDDVIVGAPTYLHDPDSGLEGAAFLYFGSDDGLSAFAGWKAGGNRARTDFGWAVGGAGDVSSDSVADLLIGAPQQFVSGTAYGAAFVFHGPIEPEPVQRTFLPLVLRDP